MATVIDTGLLSKDVRSEFLERFSAAETFYERLATRVPSDRPSENYKWLGTVPQMREWGTGRIAKGLRTESYDVDNLKYEATIQVDRDEISDDQTGQIMIRVRELAERAAEHKDVLTEQLLENGGSAGFLAYDGKTYFASDHESGASGAQDNTSTSVAADNDVNKPTVVEFKAALTQMIGQMRSFKDDQGEMMRIRSSGLLVVVNPNMEWVAREAVGASVIASTTNVLQGVADVLAMPGLTTAGDFFLLSVDRPVRPFIFQDREPVEFVSLEKGSEEEFLRERYLYGVRARYRMTYGYWQYAIRHRFTT